MTDRPSPTDQVDQISFNMVFYILAIIGGIFFLFVWYKGAYYSIMNILCKMYSAMYSCQGKMQSYFRPGIWFPVIRKLHSYREKWVLVDPSSSENKETVLAAIMHLISQDRSGQIWRVDKIEMPSQPHKEVYVQIFVYTWAKWLDIIEMNFRGEEVKVRSFSSGFLPLCIPFACVLNLFLAWIPFTDMGLNKKRLKEIVHIMGNDVIRTEEE